MNTCTHDVIGQKLHAYELGVLPNSELQEYELHLYECDHCYTQAEKLTDSVRLIRHDPDIRRLALAAAGPAATSIRVKSTRWLLAAAAVLILGLPVAYWQLQPSETQVIRLIPMRGMPTSAIVLEKGGDVEIRFVLEGADAATTARVEIRTSDGSEVYSDLGYTGFTGKGMGTVTLPVSAFEPGYFTIVITDQSESSALPSAEYRFVAQ